MRKIINPIAVIIRHTEVIMVMARQIMERTNADEIIKKANPTHPRTNIDNASANMMNANRHKRSAVTIPVIPIQIINSDRHRTVKARNVIVKNRQRIANAKNGIAVHITHNRAVRKNANEQRKHAEDDKHKIERANIRAIKARHVTNSPIITQIHPPNGNKQNPKKNIDIPISIIPCKNTIHVSERHIIERQRKILNPIADKIPQSNITAVVPKHNMANARTKAVKPHNATDRAKQATSKANGSIKAHIIASINARRQIQRANTTPIAPANSKARNSVGEQTIREQIQEITKITEHTKPNIRQDIPIIQDITQIVIANIESPIQVREHKIPNPQKAKDITNVTRHIKTMHVIKQEINNRIPENIIVKSASIKLKQTIGHKQGIIAQIRNIVDKIQQIHDSINAIKLVIIPTHGIRPSI
jgi:hypothetical protein